MKDISHNIILQLTQFINECNSFTDNLKFLKLESPILYDNIINTIDTNKVKLIIAELDKYENYKSIIDFMQFNRNLNNLYNRLLIFVGLVNLNVNKYVNLTNTVKYNYNIHLSDLISKLNIFKTLFNLESNKLNNLFTNSLADKIENTELIEINNLFNNSYFIYNKYDEDNIIEQYIKIINIQDGNKYDLTKFRIKNLLIDQYILIFGKYIDSNELITNLHESNKSNIINITNYKLSENEKAKYITEKTDDIITVVPNNLQLFNLIPYALYSNKQNKLQIDWLIKKICGIEMKNIIGEDNILSELTKIANIYSETINHNFVITIIKHDGNMVDYNINPLFNNNIRVNPAAGLTLDMLTKFKTISYDPSAANSGSNEKIAKIINYSNDKQNIGIIFDTNDFINFRLLIDKSVINSVNSRIEDTITEMSNNSNDKSSNSIFVNDNLISKLLTINNYNNRIESYNNYLEESILSNIKDNSISYFYSSVDTNYNIYINDKMYDEFTKKITNVLISNIERMYTDNPNKSVLQILIDNSNIDLFKNSIISYYSYLQLEDPEAFLTYLAALDNTISKFKKELIDSYNTSNQESDTNLVFLSKLVTDAITNVINVKSHMYDSAIEKEQIIIAFKNKMHNT